MSKTLQPTQPALERIAVNKGEAAKMLGVSRDYFMEYVYPELRKVRRGSKVMIPVAELRRWVDENADMISATA